MWGENSKGCESNCQCSGLITDSFKINSGNNATKRRREEAAAHNYKLKMKPHSLEFNHPLSPLNRSPNTPKRRVLGELQNSPRFETNSPRPLKNSPFENSPFKKNSPLAPRYLKQSPLIHRLQESPITSQLLNSPISSNIIKRSSTKLSRVFEERTKFKMSSNKENISISSETFMKLDVKEETSETFMKLGVKEESFMKLGVKEESFMKLDVNEDSFMKLGVNEETREGFGCESPLSRVLQKSRTVKNWTLAKMSSDSPAQSTSSGDTSTRTMFGLDPDLDLEPDLATLHDLDAEFECDSFDQCAKYEIISTDSPDIISRGRTESRKVEARNFVFGAPIGDTEQSTSFNKPTAATRMLTFEEDFTFTSPETLRPKQQSNISVKKSLKFLNDTPTKSILRHENSNSSIGSMSTVSPLSSTSKFRLYPSESTTSMESGFMSEIEEPFLDIEESNSPKMANFSDLLSGEIKDSLAEPEFAVKRPTFHRSQSYNPETSKVRISLFSKESTEEKRKKRTDLFDCEWSGSKRKKSNVDSLELLPQRSESLCQHSESLCNQSESLCQRSETSCHRSESLCQRSESLCQRTESLCQRSESLPRRPVLQRALSENAASIMSALARSACTPDLTGDFSRSLALPTTRGAHADLSALTSDTLAALIRNEYKDTVTRYTIVDCRYPYEYSGGHIASAVNLYTPEMVLSLLRAPPPVDERAGREIVVFHCEFSLERGPKLSRFLRSSDRAANKDNYPALHYPELYLLHEGYQAFHTQHPELCTAGYTTMMDPSHRGELAKYRRSNSLSMGKRSFM